MGGRAAADAIVPIIATCFVKLRVHHRYSDVFPLRRGRHVVQVIVPESVSSLVGAEGSEVTPQRAEDDSVSPESLDTASQGSLYRSARYHVLSRMFCSLGSFDTFFLFFCLFFLSLTSVPLLQIIFHP